MKNILLIIVVVLVANPMPAAAVTASDIAGSWSMQEVDDATACGDGIFTDTFTAVVSINGSEATISAKGEAITGTLNGNTITYKESYPEDGGTTTSTGMLTYNQGSVTGNSSWNWVGSGFSCSGTATFSGSKLSSPTPTPTADKTDPKVTQPTALIASGSFSEPNDTPSEATPILINDKPLYQTFSSPGDEDWYELYAKAGRNYTIDIPAASVGRLINPALELYDAAGKLLINQVNSGATGQGEQIRWTAPSSGLFRIRVNNQPSVAGRSPATETYQGEAADYTYQIRVFLTDAPQQILTKGRVLDDCKQGINGANVSALLGSVLADSTLTNKLGEFGLLLNAGNYELKIAATNYRETSQTVAVGQEATALIPIQLTAATTNTCVSNPATQTSLTPAFYDDRQGLLTIKNIVVDDKAVYYVELKNIGDYRFRLDKFLAIPGVILDNPPSFSSGTALATLPEVFALTRNWKVQLKYVGNGILTIHSASPH